MYHFVVEDTSESGNSCQPCCCKPVSMKPGTTIRLTVNYAPWAVPIGELHCAPQFMIEQMQTCAVPIGSNLPPQLGASDMVKFDTGMNVPLTADLKDKVVDPESDPMTFKLLQLYGPKYGKLVLATDGAFTYTPNFNFKGEERFYCTVTDGVNEPITFEVLIAVGIDSGTMAHTPHISIGPAVIDRQLYTVHFPVSMSPAAKPCEIWRLTVLQAAIDCGCQCYTRTDCFDIKVADC